MSQALCHNSKKELRRGVCKYRYKKIALPLPGGGGGISVNFVSGINMKRWKKMLEEEILA
jgi:hypothetical protein